jgi:hypothetical protein
MNLDQKSAKAWQVLDEYGTSIVTIHSWRTFGEIEDEHDSDEELIEKEHDTIFFFFGSLWCGVFEPNYKSNIQGLWLEVLSTKQKLP